MVGDLVKRNIGNLVLLVINVVSQERRSLVNPKREKTRMKTSEEYPVISNPKGHPS